MSTSKSFFISARKDRSAEANALTEKLQAHGWKRTYAWTEDDGDGEQAYAKIAIAELGGVIAADVLIALLPGGFGTHVEIGAALALGKPVILYAPDKITLDTPYLCIFHYHPKVTRIISAALELEVVLAAIEKGSTTS